MLWAEGVRHAFGGVRALDDVSFTLPSGRTLALFGPNGAGKTTLLKVLVGLIRPQQGRAGVEGGRRAVGWIGHQAMLYAHLTVAENLQFWAALYDVPPSVAAVRQGELLARLGLEREADRRVVTLSRGQLQRAAIVRALIHDPRVLLLDEPFTGLDATAAAEFRDVLARFATEGRATILVTHNVEEGTGLATDIGFLKAGRLVACAPRAGRTAADVAAEYRRVVAHV